MQLKKCARGKLLAEDHNQPKSPMGTENKTSRPRKSSRLVEPVEESVSGLDVRQLLGLGRAEPKTETETAFTAETVETELLKPEAPKQPVEEASWANTPIEPTVQRPSEQPIEVEPSSVQSQEKTPRPSTPLQRPTRPAFDSFETKPATQPNKTPEPAAVSSARSRLGSSFNEIAESGKRPIAPVTKPSELSSLRPSIDPLAASTPLSPAKPAGEDASVAAKPIVPDPSIAANAKLEELASLSERTLEDYETFDDFDDSTPQQSKRTPIIILASLLLIAVLAGGVVFAYRQGVRESNQTSLPIIVAETKSVKEEPSNPGGVKIPNQNKLIYDRILGEETDIAEKIVSREEKVAAFTTVTKTLPSKKADVPPVPAAPGTPTNPDANQTAVPANGLKKIAEDGTKKLTAVTPPKPLSPPESIISGGAVVPKPDTNTPAAVTAPQTSSPQTETLDLPSGTLGQKPAQQNGGIIRLETETITGTQTPEAPSTSGTATPSTEKLAIAKLVEESVETGTDPAVKAKLPPVLPRRKPPPPSSQPRRVASAETTPATPSPVTRSSAGNFVIQIAAFRSQEEALSRYTSLKRRHSSLLRPYTSFIQRADLGDQGVYYRLRLGPIDGKEKASDLCRSLLSAGEKDCLVRIR
jgi:SPOR domain